VRGGKTCYLISVFNGGPRSLLGAELSKAFIDGSRRFNRWGRGRGSGGVWVNEILGPFLRHSLEMKRDRLRVGFQDCAQKTLEYESIRNKREIVQVVVVTFWSLR
jgi:hypothetical protein